MSDMNLQVWLEAAYDNFHQAIDAGDLALAKDIIADVLDKNLEAGQTMNEELRAVPLSKFAVKSPIQDL